MNNSSNRSLCDLFSLQLQAMMSQEGMSEKIKRKLDKLYQELRKQTRRDLTFITKMTEDY